MRANLLWYIPLCALAVGVLVIPGIVSGYHNVLIVFHRFSWLILVSPAAYVFFSCVLGSVLVPIQMMVAIPAFFDPEATAYRRRYLWSVGVVLGATVACFLLQVIIWGSFPTPVGHDGYIHVRMIPFLPWPQSPLFR